MSSSSNKDLPNLATALEYADLAAALYLAGGSDHAARLLAAAAEQVLGDLARLLGEQVQTDEIQTLLARIALRYQAPAIEPRGSAQQRRSQFGLLRPSELGGQHEDEVRSATAAYLRASWYLLESMGLEAVIPNRLHQAIETSTIVAPVDI
ncbi:hypothetical protein [Pelomonas sp. KK5]|uniref:hypothetical protein n=1 Tax=Pelomonas sp. KK5 TaxID=1855730 RepID=UPI00097C0CB6|nr:hypothetical protein [Pelomonas sp. KK5]